MNGCAPDLALIERLKATWKWAIHLCNQSIPYQCIESHFCCGELRLTRVGVPLKQLHSMGSTYQKGALLGGRVLIKSIQHAAHFCRKVPSLITSLKRDKLLQVQDIKRFISRQIFMNIHCTSTLSINKLRVNKTKN